MKSIFYLIVCLFCFVGSIAIDPAMAQDATADPLISLTVKNEPLGDVLETISRDTGYRFNLNGEWNKHPVSAVIVNLPLEKGLNRLLRSLNHSIVWESDKVVTIMVYGKADPGRSDSAATFASPPPAYQEANEPPAENEPASAGEPESGAETVETEGAAAEEASRQPGEGAPTPPEIVNPGDNSAAGNAEAGNPPIVE